jgi:LCP family protein required for cell wall assembly
MKKLTKDKFSFALLIVNILLLAGSISYFSYTLLLLGKIETPLRIGIIIFLIILSILCIITIIKSIFKNKRIKILIITTLSLIFSILTIIIGYNVNKIYSAISKISTNSQTYSTSIVSLKENEINAIEEIKSEKIGILNDEKSVDGYQIPQEIIKENKLENELVEYDNYLDLINDLLNKKIDLIFLPTNYSILFGNIEGLENLNEKTKIIYTKDKNIKIEKTLNTKNLDKPFTVLIMGVDSEQENIKGSSFNGDSLILITFNPKTLNATMLSIPRDTYTPIACFAGQKKNKITHAAWYGESCMMQTIENIFNINIDYYIKINFKGVTSIVDALGGVEINVPYNFCESNSNREIGGSSTIYVREGLQTLNGEQALALARNRHPWPEYCSSEWTNYNSNDFIRGQNQQLVIQGMLNKIKNINSIDTFYNMLNSISNNMETNMSTDNILSFYNIGKDILSKNANNKSDLSNLIGFERMYLSGYDQTIVDYDGRNNSGSGLALYNFVPYKGSIEDISEEMKINLGLIEQKINTKYEFDINTPYEKKVIGKGYYSDYSVSLLPSFVGKDINEAKSYCNARGINVSINTVTTNSKSLDGEIMSQSLPSGMDAQYATSITFNVAEYKEDKTNENTENDATEKTNTNKKTEQEKTNTQKKESEIKETDKPSTNNNNNTNGNNNNSNENNNNEQSEEPEIPGTPTEDDKDE